MSSTALYKAFIEVGASQEAATEAAEDVIQVSQLSQLATKVDIEALKSEIALLGSDVAAEFGSVRSYVAAEIGSSRSDSSITAATKVDIEALKSEIALLRSDAAVDIANLEIRLLKWMVGCGFLFAGVVIAGVGIVIQIMLSPGVAQ